MRNKGGRVKRWERGRGDEVKGKDSREEWSASGAGAVEGGGEVVERSLPLDE